MKRNKKIEQIRMKAVLWHKRKKNKKTQTLFLYLFNTLTNGASEYI